MVSLHFWTWCSTPLSMSWISKGVVNRQLKVSGWAQINKSLSSCLILKVQIPKRGVSKDWHSSKQHLYLHLLFRMFSWSTCGTRILEDTMAVTMVFWRSYSNAISSCSVRHLKKSCSLLLGTMMTKAMNKISRRISIKISKLFGLKFTSQNNLRTLQQANSSILISS